MRVDGGLDEVERPAEVGVQITLPLLGSDLIDPDAGRGAGVVDEDVDPTGGLSEGSHGCGDRLGVADIEFVPGEGLFGKLLRQTRQPPRRP